MDFLRHAEEDLRALATESKKKYPEVKESVDRAVLRIQDLRSQYAAAMRVEAAPQVHDFDIQDILRPYLLVTNYGGASGRLLVIALSGIQRLTAGGRMDSKDVASIMRVLTIQSETNVGDIQLKVMQTLVLVLTSCRDTPGIDEEVILQALEICFRMHGVSKSIINNTAAASLSQVVTTLFDKVRASIRKNEGGAIPLKGLEKYAGLLIEDLCAAVRGDCTVWLSKRCHVPKSLALDVLETIIVQYPDIYSGRDGFRELLGVQVCPSLVSGIKTETQLPLLIRLVRVAVVIFGNTAALVLDATAKMVRALLDLLREVHPSSQPDEKSLDQERSDLRSSIGPGVSGRRHGQEGAVDEGAHATNAPGAIRRRRSSSLRLTFDFEGGGTGASGPTSSARSAELRLADWRLTLAVDALMRLMNNASLVAALFGQEEVRCRGTSLVHSSDRPVRRISAVPNAVVDAADALARHVCEAASRGEGLVQASATSSAASTMTSTSAASSTTAPSSVAPPKGLDILGLGSSSTTADAQLSVPDRHAAFRQAVQALAALAERAGLAEEELKRSKEEKNSLLQRPAVKRSMSGSWTSSSATDLNLHWVGRCELAGLIWPSLLAAYQSILTYCDASPFLVQLALKSMRSFTLSCAAFQLDDARDAHVIALCRFAQSRGVVAASSSTSSSSSRHGFPGAPSFRKSHHGGGPGGGFLSASSSGSSSASLAASALPSSTGSGSGAEAVLRATGVQGIQTVFEIAHSLRGDLGAAWPFLFETCEALVKGLEAHAAAVQGSLDPNLALLLTAEREIFTRSGEYEDVGLERMVQELVCFSKQALGCARSAWTAEAGSSGLVSDQSAGHTGRHQSPATGARDRSSTAAARSHGSADAGADSLRQSASSSFSSSATTHLPSQFSSPLAAAAAVAAAATAAVSKKSALHQGSGVGARGSSSVAGSVRSLGSSLQWRKGTRSSRSQNGVRAPTGPLREDTAVVGGDFVSDSLGNVGTGGSLQPFGFSPATRLYALLRLVEVAQINRHRLALIWSPVADHLAELGTRTEEKLRGVAVDSFLKLLSEGMALAEGAGDRDGGSVEGSAPAGSAAARRATEENEAEAAGKPSQGDTEAAAVRDSAALRLPSTQQLLDPLLPLCLGTYPQSQRTLLQGLHSLLQSHGFALRSAWGRIFEALSAIAAQHRGAAAGRGLDDEELSSLIDRRPPGQWSVRSLRGEQQKRKRPPTASLGPFMGELGHSATGQQPQRAEGQAETHATGAAAGEVRRGPDSRAQLATSSSREDGAFSGVERPGGQEGVLHQGGGVGAHPDMREGRNADTSGSLPLAFACAELAIEDFLPSIPRACLIQLLRALRCFGAQTADLNVALTAINKMWAVADFIASQEEDKEQRGDADHPEVGDRVKEGAEGFAVTTGRHEAHRVVHDFKRGQGAANGVGGDAAAGDVAGGDAAGGDAAGRDATGADVIGGDAVGDVSRRGSKCGRSVVAGPRSEWGPLWSELFLQMGILCTHARPDIRNCALTTLLSTATSLGSKLGPATWRIILVDTLLPVMDAADEASAAASLAEELQREGSGSGSVAAAAAGDSARRPRMLVHHSRDNAVKQWSETRVLALEGAGRSVAQLASALGLTQVSATGPVSAADGDWVNETWAALLVRLRRALRIAEGAGREYALASVGVLSALLARASVAGREAAKADSASTAGAAGGRRRVLGRTVSGMRVVDGALVRAEEEGGSGRLSEAETEADRQPMREGPGARGGEADTEQLDGGRDVGGAARTLGSPQVLEPLEESPLWASSWSALCQSCRLTWPDPEGDLTLRLLQALTDALALSGAAELAHHARQQEWIRAVDALASDALVGVLVCRHCGVSPGEVHRGGETRTPEAGLEVLEWSRGTQREAQRRLVQALMRCQPKAPSLWTEIVEDILMYRRRVADQTCRKCAEAAKGEEEEGQEQPGEAASPEGPTPTRTQDAAVSDAASRARNAFMLELDEALLAVFGSEQAPAQVRAAIFSEMLQQLRRAAAHDLEQGGTRRQQTISELVLLVEGGFSAFLSTRTPAECQRAWRDVLTSAELLVQGSRRESSGVELVEDRGVKDPLEALISSVARVLGQVPKDRRCTTEQLHGTLGILCTAAGLGPSLSGPHTHPGTESVTAGGRLADSCRKGAAAFVLHNWTVPASNHSTQDEQAGKDTLGREALRCLLQRIEDQFSTVAVPGQVESLSPLQQDLSQGSPQGVGSRQQREDSDQGAASAITLLTAIVDGAAQPPSRESDKRTLENADPREACVTCDILDYVLPLMPTLLKSTVQAPEEQTKLRLKLGERICGLMAAMRLDEHWAHRRWPCDAHTD